VAHVDPGPGSEKLNATQTRSLVGITQMMRRSSKSILKYRQDGIERQLPWSEKQHLKTTAGVLMLKRNASSVRDVENGSSCRQAVNMT
jgi:hypothetical protein